MATLLDAPKGPTPAKLEEFVEKQLRAARRRVRVLDFFLTGLVLGIGTLVFLLAVQLVDRYVETPRGAGWGVAGLYLALATAFVYLVLFRPSRRQINPYFAAHQVERTVPNAKNSLVTWVDFEEDGRLPGSIKTAISQKAYRDIKGVDLNRAIENRKILWLAITAGVLLLGNAIVAFLPPTRTELTLQLPKDGDITVFSNQEVAFQVRVQGRIPGPNEPDAVRLRMWYNPDDPDSYEDRPLKASEGNRREFGVVVPAKQVRTGFRYKVLGGNAQTPEYTVTAKILPEFRDFEVAYEFPTYLKQPPEKTNDPNLIAPFGSKVTLIVTTTREVKQGFIQFEGQDATLDGQLVEGRPDAIQFAFPLKKEGTYQVFFTTTDGDKNTDPTKFRITVYDAKPVFQSFDVAYEYPAYLRYKPMKVTEAREPQIDAPTGTKIVLTARTNRPVKAASMELPGVPQPVAGELLPDQPTAVRFKLPALMTDGNARVTFTPDTSEPTGPTKTVPIHLHIDQAPKVQITEPQAKEVELPANGTLDLRGIATDDHGVDKLTLRMVLTGPKDLPIVARPYRGGMSFLREKDNSWPTRVDYQDFVKLPDLRLESDPTWRAGPGMRIEYWLEVVDNCAVPHPNQAESRPPVRTIVIEHPFKADQKQIDQQNRQREEDQKRHEQQQDQKNQKEDRTVKQEPPKGAEPQGEPKEGDPQPKTENRGGGEPKAGPPDAKADPKGEPPAGKDEDPGGKPPETAPDHEARTKEVERALQKTREGKDPKANPGDPEKTPDGKADPGGTPPPQGGVPKTDTPPKAGAKDPTTDPGMHEPGPMPTPVDPKTKERLPKTDNPPTPKVDGKDPMTDPAAKGKDPATPDKGEPKVGPGDPKAEPMPKVDGKDPKADPGAKSTEPGKGTDPKSEPGPMPGEVDPKTGQRDPKSDRPPGGGMTEPKSDPGAGKQPMKKDGMGGTEKQPGTKEGDPTGGKATPKAGMKEENPEDPKAGPGTPPKGGNPQKGDLDRELGKLDREINSPKPEVDPEAKSDVERLMRNPETRQQTRDELDKIEKNAKDELSRKKAQDLRQAGEKAARDYDAEKPNKENVDQLAKKLDSKDEKERQEAQNRARDWEKNPQTREDLKKEVDELKKKDREAGEKVEDAMKKAEQARKDGGKGGKGGDPKVDEKKLSDIARDLNSKDEKTREKAEQQLKDMTGGDGKASQQVQDKLKELAKNAKTDEEKQNLENAARRMEQMARKDAGKEPSPKVDEKALKDAADKLASDDPKTREEGKRQLEQMTQDPKTGQQAKDMLDQMAKDAKTPEQKKNLENAANQTKEMAKKEAGKEGGKEAAKGPTKEPGKEVAKEPGPMPKEKLDPKDTEKLAKDMAGKDPAAKEAAEKKMQELMNDPKTREQAMEQLKEMAKNAPSEDLKKAIQEAMQKGHEVAKNDPKKDFDPKAMDELARKFDQMDEKAKEDLRKKFEEAMKDPELQKEMKKQAEDVAKNGTDEQKKKFDDLMKQLGRGQYPDLGGTPDPADPKNRLKAAELTLEDFKKLMTKDGKVKGLDWTPEQIDRWMKDQQATIEALRQQALKGGARDVTAGKSAVKDGPGKVDFVGKEGGNLSQGGRYAPPSGYADPYKQFSTDAARGGAGKK